jgi:formyltetrahydrofolate deformylase
MVNLIEMKKKKIVILATKEAHCIGDLLLRAKSDSLNIEIQSVLANHEDLGDLTSKFDIPFHFIDHKNLAREEHAKLMMDQIDKYDPDYIVLAKYMRFLPENFVSKYKNKIINIHHSFLPAFIGAKPYEQAYKRGVKIIGATSHFVTIDLDEGPIIEQNVLHIDHSYNAQELGALGKDVEQLVLSKALKYITEDRVFVHENKTIVFK